MAKMMLKATNLQCPSDSKVCPRGRFAGRSAASADHARVDQPPVTRCQPPHVSHVVIDPQMSVGEEFVEEWFFLIDRKRKLMQNIGTNKVGAPGFKSGI